MVKLIYIAVAIMLIGSGFVVFPLPIPFGALMIACGLILLISNSSSVAHWIRMIRRRHRMLDKMIRAAAKRLPDSWRKVLNQTEP
ncbi:MAG: hypothetical protein ACR2PG_01605 [Hyphomicrobiaceae bacterium]